MSGRAWTIGAAVAAIALVIVASRRADVLDALGLDSATVVPLPDGSSEQGQGGGALEAALAALDPMTYINVFAPGSTSSSSDPNPSDPGATDPYAGDDSQPARNRSAFLSMIRASEGTSGPDGYRTMFGYRTFTDFSDHPRQAVQFTRQSDGAKLWTTAAGAYQLMAVSPLPGGGSTRVDTWDRLKAKLQLPDFTPGSQDAAALELVDECGALGDVDAGRLADAVTKCRKVWASLPGAGYGQPERSLDTLQAAFTNAGGTLA